LEITRDMRAASFSVILERYARRLPKGRKAESPGELVQIDTLVVNVRPNVAVKHFTAYDPVAKWTIGKAATSASAQSAKSLLDKLITEAPFEVSGIKVDGGSQFRSVFEQERQARGLELFVLPPKRPDLNGCVERAQSTWRYEFYATYDLPHRVNQLQVYLDAFAYRFNHHRPHDALPDARLPSISNLPAAAIQSRLICAEPGHAVEIRAPVL
jgi:putative transposase